MYTARPFDQGKRRPLISKRSYHFKSFYIETFKKLTHAGFIGLDVFRALFLASYINFYRRLKRAT